MSKSKIVITFGLILIISIFVFSEFYQETELLGGLKMNYDKGQIKQLAQQFADDLNISTKGLIISADLKADKPLIRQVQLDCGVKKGNKLLRNSLPGFYWKIDWKKQEGSTVRISSGSDGDDVKSDNNDKLTLVYDNQGNLLEFSRHFADSTALANISPQKARRIVKEFISRFGTIKNLSSGNASIKDTSKLTNYSFVSGSNEEYDFKIERRVELPHRTDYQYTWKGNSAYIKDKIQMDITVSGNVVSDFKLEYLVPNKYKIDDSQTYKATVTILFYVIIFVLLGIVSYKRIKASEIGFKLAFFFGIIELLSFGIHFFTLISDQFSWVMLIPMLLGPLLFGAALFITWAVSEAVTRDTWKEKFLPVDLLSNGYLFHSKVGESVYIGLSSGFGLTVLWILLLLIIQNFTGIWSVSYNNDFLSFLNSYSPSLSIIDKNIYTALFSLAIFFNFILSGLRKRMNSGGVLILVGAIIWGMVNVNEIHPVIIGILLEVVVGLVLTIIYYRFDALTTIIAIVSFNTINDGLSLFTTGNISYIQSGYFFIGLLILLIILSSIALFTEDKITEYDSITPAFVKNITERQRLQRELEIARDVQMSFLPTKNPNFKGLQIASRCIPALEVGGDYYDFVNLNEHKFGIIIGDVSGKGTQAAFYMTLTKGFLKALSKSSDSPASVLKEMNSLFYENVERGTFISMIYGIFDTKNKTFKLARAGHNPVIVKNSINGKIEMLNPKGLALGLEKGDIFNKNINEIEISIERDDVFVFYTDGFPEAMNKVKEEFGEEKLAEIVKQNSGNNADQLLEKLFTETKSFIGKAEQHDDMTMVIVKVL